MIIAVNTISLLNDHPEADHYFIYETFKRITISHPEHQFIFIFDRSFDERLVFGKNVRAIATRPVKKHPLFWKLWYDIKIPSILKKYKADVFVSSDGFCSLAAKVPQCLVIHDLAFLHHSFFIKRSHWQFYKKNIAKFLNKARCVVTTSEFSKQDIIDHYKIEPEKIDVVYSAGKEVFQPMNEEEKTLVKNKYTEGKEYFLYTGAIHPAMNLNLLKAFSIFKKRQQTNMKLVLAGRLASKYESFTQSLKTYKYRDDVLLTGYMKEEELAKITGAAYALVYPSLPESFAVRILEAMRSDVPVITSTGVMQEIIKDAALYADPASHTAIAEKMMLLYKDENLRKQLIKQGAEIALQYSWDITADLLWKCMLKAVT